MPLSIDQLSDEIVAAAARGSKQEIDQVLQAMAPQVRLMVTARLSATPSQFHAVEDIVQNVVVGLTTAISRLENRTVVGLKAFASGIASRKVVDHLRSRGARQGEATPRVSLDSIIGHGSAAGPLWEFLSGTLTSPSVAADRTDRFAELMTELGRLKQEYREVITLAFFDQLPTASIAACLGISRPAASMLLIRAVRTLRRNMTGSSEVGVNYDD